MIFPVYDGWLTRYRPARRVGPLHVEFSPDHLPWPQVSAWRSGDSVELSVQFGPLGPDPVLMLWVRIPRPGAKP